MIDLNTKVVCMAPGGTISVTVAELFAALPAAEHESLKGLMGGNPSGNEHYHLAARRYAEVNRCATERGAGLMSAESFKELQDLRARVAALEALVKKDV